MDLILDRIKKILEIVKAAFWYVLLPVGAIISYILLLKSKVSDLQAEKETTKVDVELSNVLEKKIEADKHADDAIGEYKRIRDAFIRGDKTDV